LVFLPLFEQRVRGTGSPLQIKKPSDVTLRNGVYLLQLEHAVAPECVNTEEILEPATAVECKLNAKYAVSCAHKMGCRGTRPAIGLGGDRNALTLRC
jgi:hypothetical protein